ncbi:MAG TPA: penicillin acylase family protein, partial [Acidobacteriota bacterium]|nr:penicillin acylase family protein [Acidobacteriota bacterium]
MLQRIIVSVLVLTLAASVFLYWEDDSAQAGTVMTPQELQGLRAAVRVVRDEENVPHIFTQNDHDGMFMIGYLHARDRLFQMDVSRRLFSGTLAELVGQAALPQDIQLRTLGLRRAAERSVDAYSPRTRRMVQAYADGVNAYLDEGNPLPPEYPALELATVEPWTLLDTLTVAKGLAFGLSFDLDDIDRSVALMTFQEAGEAGGFDGTALFFEDTYRVEPLDGTVSIPEAGLAGDSTRARRSDDASRDLTAIAQRMREIIRPQTLQLMRNYLSKLDGMPELREMLSLSRRAKGSNWWLIGPDNSATGNALFANDPHLALDTPATFYEAHLEVAEDPALGAMNVAGVTFPGAPNFVQGCNQVMCWGSTVNPLDVTDVYQETLVVNFPSLGAFPQIMGTRFGDEIEPVEPLGQSFDVNDPTSGIQDDVSRAAVGALEGAVTLIVPRRNNGPIVDFELPSVPLGTVDIAAISVQYTGWGATREGEAFFRIARAESVEE